MIDGSRPSSANPRCSSELLVDFAIPKCSVTDVKPFIIGLVLTFVACHGGPSTTPAPAANREVRLLEADDPALSPVLLAAAKHIFDPSRGDGSFGGVFVNNQLVRPLTM